MLGACGAWLLHEVIVIAAGAAAELWLADSLHVVSGTRSLGSDASISATVHGVRRVLAAVRTRRTSAAATGAPVLPKFVRT